MVGLVQMIVGVIVGIILVVAVAIPISISVIDTVNWTNYATAETVAALIPLGLAVAALILAFQMVAGESG
jgi:hypothetical protein